MSKRTRHAPPARARRYPGPRGLTWMVVGLAAAVAVAIEWGANGVGGPAAWNWALIVSFIAMTAAIALPIMWQQVAIDTKAARLHVRSAGTGWRWRGFDARDVALVELHPAAGARRRLVSLLVLTVVTEDSPGTITLRESTWSMQGDGPLFRAVLALLARRGSGCRFDANAIALMQRPTTEAGA